MLRFFPVVKGGKRLHPEHLQRATHVEGQRWRVEHHPHCLKRAQGDSHH